MRRLPAMRGACLIPVKSAKQRGYFSAQPRVFGVVQGGVALYKLLCLFTRQMQSFAVGKNIGYAASFSLGISTVSFSLGISTAPMAL